MLRSIRCVQVLALAAAACSDTRGSDVSQGNPTDSNATGGSTTDAGGGSSSGDGTGASSGGTSGPATTTDGTGDSDTSDGDIPKFDIPMPDLGEEPPPPTGIPETCAEALQTQSTVGCSFHANKMQNFIEEPTSLIVGNVSVINTATVQLYYGGGGVETPEGQPVVVGPLQAYEFILDKPAEPGDVSVLRVGGAYRVESDIPVVAYQHSPISAQAHNDSSMLIPDHMLGLYHIVAAWGTNIGSDYSMFNVVGIHDDTLVEWEPRNATMAGSGVSAVNPPSTGSAMVSHFDLLQVASTLDMSGTIVETDKPAWVMGTVPCVNIPANVTFCDHIEELLIPLEYWGTEYVGAHAPQRGNEHFWWRIYSGADGTTITTNPPQTGTPVTLDRGEFHEFSTTESFMFTGDGPFMPVQYLEGQDAGAGTGDPASYQMVPTEQFLPRYVFITGTGYTWNYVQIIRPVGGPPVLVDDVQVTGYYQVGAFEVADWPIEEGAHVADSAEPYGITQVGYTTVTSYAYPGGLALGFINPNPEG